MKRILLLLTAVIASLTPLRAQQIEATLGDSSFVSIITCGPGSEFYTTWGHSAIRVCDPELGLDLVYNYGTFDFNTKHFYLKFAQGRLDYCLSRGAAGRLIPLPREISAGCGLAWSAPPGDMAGLRDLLAGAGIAPQHIKEMEI